MTSSPCSSRPAPTPWQASGQIAAIHNALSAPLDIEGFPLTVGVSIGVATAPEDGHTGADLLRAADVAMYKAKRCGTPIEFYDNCVKSPQHGRLSLLSDLSEALNEHQLHIHFQPQLRMVDGAVDTVEALIRWQHPEHGSIPPSEFIGVAEQTDLIGPITELVLRAATVGMITASAGDVKLAVNVSARSLQDANFADEVLSVLDKSGFPPDRLELEVTERAIVTNVERSTYTIGRLRQEGVRIAIDDFGVGYSSYQTLRLLDVDRVKIDRDFVANLTTEPRDRLIVASLIAPRPRARARRRRRGRRERGDLERADDARLRRRPGLRDRPPDGVPRPAWLAQPLERRPRRRARDRAVVAGVARCGRAEHRRARHPVPPHRCRRARPQRGDDGVGAAR